MVDPPSPGGDAPRVVIAMLTYRRPDDLRAALPEVIAQSDGAPCRASILVVDNDPDASAVAMAGEVGGEQVRFVHEETPGIPAARNRALDEAGDADALVFIDDDERPEPGWLAALVTTWRATGAAAVVGPVESTFPEDPDPWIERGGFFKRPRRPTGTDLDYAATNNLLLDLAQLRRIGVRFDARFDMSGGSDTLFSWQLHRGGGRIVWCDEACVVDVVPLARLNRPWVLRRALRMGNSWSRAWLVLERGPGQRLRRRLVLTGQGVVRVVGGAARLALGGITRSVTHRARGARTLARGLGITSGAWGYTYAEYRRPAAP
jgi:glycosyltransferase involved in cell wall biosynthesis